MAQKQGGGKKKRATKVSKGIHGGGGRLTIPLSEAQKVNMGKGLLNDVARRWRPQTGNSFNHPASDHRLPS